MVNHQNVTFTGWDIFRSRRTCMMQCFLLPSSLHHSRVLKVFSGRFENKQSLFFQVTNPVRRSSCHKYHKPDSVATKKRRKIGYNPCTQTPLYFHWPAGPVPDYNIMMSHRHQTSCMVAAVYGITSHVTQICRERSSVSFMEQKLQIMPHKQVSNSVFNWLQYISHGKYTTYSFSC